MKRAGGSYRAMLRASRFAARLAPEVWPRLAGTMRANIRHAFGRSDERLVRATYRHFAAAIVDLIYFDRLFDERHPERHFQWTGSGFQHYVDQGRGGAVMVTGHFGNWELFAGSFRQLDMHLSAVARPPESEWFGRWLERFRRARGIELIDKDNALPLAMKAIRRGVCVAFLVDQAAGRHGIPVPFFGLPAQTVTAPAALALKLGVPLYAGYSTRIGDGIKYRCYAEPIDLSGDAETITAKINATLEGYVRARPEQWWWFHKRFKPPRLERAGRPVDAAGVPVS